MSDFDPIRDCPHGRQKGKCDSCDLEQAEKIIEQQQQRIAELEQELTQYRIDNLKLKATNNELSAMVEQLRGALKHLHHNAKASGAEMGLALDVAEEALESTPQQSLAEHDAEQWKIGAASFKAELHESVTLPFRPHIEGVFRVWLEHIKENT